jgi:hypothetical protein
MPSVFRCSLCFAVFKNCRRAHYSDASEGFCPGVLKISEIELDELILASVTRRKTRSKRDRAKLVAKRKQIMPTRVVVQRCQECEGLGDLCTRCHHKKMKRDWMRAKRARLKEERRAAAASIAGLFGASPS